MINKEIFVIDEPGRLCRKKTLSRFEPQSQEVQVRAIKVFFAFMLYLTNYGQTKTRILCTFS